MKTKIFLFLFFCGILFVPIMPEILDSYDESHQDTTYALFAGSTITYGQAFSAIVNCTLDHAVFFLKKNGAPTGYVIARVYASTGTFGSSAKPTGTALAVSDNVNISTITGTYALTTFNFSGANRVNLTTGVKYIVVVSYSGGDGSNNLNVGADNVDSVAPGNACYSVDNINWTALSATDVCFYVYVVSAINTKATTWGWLSKSQLDPTTVDQAIALAIAAHESDPTAHLGAGESIEMHRNSEVIDHLAYSIVTDKVKDGQLLLEHFSQNRMFQNISPADLIFDNAGSGSFGNSVYSQTVTGPNINQWYWSSSGNDDMYGLTGARDLSPRFRMRVIFNDPSAVTGYFGIGDFGGDSALGFKIYNDSLHAVWWDSNPAEHLMQIVGIDLSVAHNYEVVLVKGVSITWSIDGNIVYTLLWADISPDIVCVGPLNIYIKKPTSTLVYAVAYQILLEQDYF